MQVTENNQKALAEDASLIASYQHLSELPLAVKSAHGSKIVDADGKEYLDFTSAACTMDLGYTLPKTEDYASFPFPYATGLKQLELASHLVTHYPGADPAEVRVAFGVCGSEANDAAIKLCRAYTGRKKIVCFEGDYHGTTFGAASMTTIPGRLSNKFAPMVDEIHVLPFCDETAEEDQIDECLYQLTCLDYEKIAGFIIEPVQGDMGMLAMHQRLLKQLYLISRTWGIAFVVDEVQMAFHRSGPFFSIENYADVIPDAILMGKQLGAGVPLSCVMGKVDFMSSLGPCEHAFSMAGNSEACARGLEALKIIEAPGFVSSLDERMMILYEGLNSIARRHPKTVSHLTGIGFAFGIWVKSNDPSLSDNEACYLVLSKAFELGLYTMRLGSNWLRIEPMLNIDIGELKEGLLILDRALTALDEGKINKECLKWMLR